MCFVGKEIRNFNAEFEEDAEGKCNLNILLSEAALRGLHDAACFDFSSGSGFSAHFIRVYSCVSWAKSGVWVFRNY